MGWEGFDELGAAISLFVALVGIILLLLSAIAVIGYMAISRNRRKIHLLYVLPLSLILIVAFASIGGEILSFLLLHSLGASQQEILFLQSTTVFLLLLFFGHIRLLRRLYGRPMKPSSFFYVFGFVGIAMLAEAVYECSFYHSPADIASLLTIPLVSLFASAVCGHLAIARTKRKLLLLYVLPVSWSLIVGLLSLSECYWEDRPPSWIGSHSDAFLVSCGIAFLVVLLVLHVLLLRRLYRRREELKKEDTNRRPNLTIAPR